MQWSDATNATKKQNMYTDIAVIVVVYFSCFLHHNNFSDTVVDELPFTSPISYLVTVSYGQWIPLAVENETPNAIVFIVSTTLQVVHLHKNSITIQFTDTDIITIEDTVASSINITISDKSRNSIAVGVPEL
jgi:hypothetical protein